MKLQEMILKKILVLDGAMGTQVQEKALTEEDYRRAETLRHVPGQLKGNHDLLSLTRPDVVTAIHEEYLAAGADIIETNTFNSTSVSQNEYGLAALATELNRAAAGLARKAADKFTAMTPEKPRFVAGSVGPMNKTLSLSPDVERPEFRAVDFDAVASAYEEQMEALVLGEVDALLIETIFDSLNARAALVAADNVFSRTGRNVPIFLSVTITDKSGRTLSGQTLEAFMGSMSSPWVAALGLNCSFGAHELMPFVREMAEKSALPLIFYPNAGLPDALGCYHEQPEETAAMVRQLAVEGCLNIVGGCCGTSPAHIAAVTEAVKDISPRMAPVPSLDTVFCGLEAVTLKKENNFFNVGERTNVAGSAKFARLIREKNYRAALDIAREQVENGAQMIDINFDDGLLDAQSEMINFLRLIAADPEIARVPVMIDSSRPDVLESGLKSIAGKPVVNSISLKNGEAAFLKDAALIRRFGAAAVVMAFDEKGQADTFERKKEVCGRAYRLLTGNGFPAQDIIFDPNILAVATGLPEHDRYALDTLEAISWIRENLPRVHVSGGVSNLSFAFRGNNAVREAMHAVFLYHAGKRGMDMGIVNPALLIPYDEVEPELRELAEDVIFCRRSDAGERLLEAAGRFSGKERQTESTGPSWRTLSLKERVIHGLVAGIDTFVEEDVDAIRPEYPSALSVIEDVLMAGMREVGDRFGDGRMFLPQVVRSARVMKRAVSVLQPYIEAERSGGSGGAGKVLLATVKGDVHDIGKNIVGVVLGCNGFEVIDLGVMVPHEQILETARAEKVDIIGVSGLITPSLDEMVHLAKRMTEEGMEIPLMVGGATTSKLHTALKIAPHFETGVVWTPDASRCAQAAQKLVSDQRMAFIQEQKKGQAELRAQTEAQQRPLVTLQQARQLALRSDWDLDPAVPCAAGIHELWPGVKELRAWIDWTFFFTGWGMQCAYPAILEDGRYGEEARRLFADAEAMLDRLETDPEMRPGCVLGLAAAQSEGDDIVMFPPGSEEIRLPMLRRQEFPERRFYPSMADFIAPKASGVKDYMGAFVTTAGQRPFQVAKEFETAGDPYNAMIVRLLADRIAEAAAEWLHARARRELWGYAPDENLNIREILTGKYRGIRPAFGYPSLRDHEQKRPVFRWLEAERVLGITLTETAMMMPEASVCGLMFAGKLARYEDVRRITAEQEEDYRARTKKAGRDKISIGDIVF